MHKIPKKEDIQRKHLMAFDYGRKFTGVANFRYQSDPFILKYGRLAYKSDEDLISEIDKLTRSEFVDIVVLGIPYFTDGTESKLTKEILSFGEKLKQTLKIPVYFQDETLTSFEAEQRMLNDPATNFQVDLKQIDAVAASIILEEFINNVERKC